MSRRFPHDLGTAIRLAQQGSIQHASAVAADWYVSVRDGAMIDPRVAAFIRAANVRYRADPRRDIAKALLLVRPKAGNPGGVSKKRRLTPGGVTEVGLMLIELRKGMPEKKAVLTVKEIFGVSERTIRAAAKQITE